MKLHGDTSLATEIWHPPRLSAHRPASELALTARGRREGAGGRSGEAPCCCCQAFPFKARARSGYSLFPPALTTNPLPSSSLLEPGAPVPSGTARPVWGKQPGHGVPAPRGGGGSVTRMAICAPSHIHAVFSAFTHFLFYPYQSSCCCSWSLPSFFIHLAPISTIC